VSFARNGSDLIITQGSQSAIINWNDFSISSGALTQFIQNGGDAAALNRVVTLTPSMINGTLSANGQIFLINPNGITVGAGGVIDTAAFIGSTLDVSNEDFLNGGALNFIGDSDAAITNLGSISGDAGVFLFAQQIDNAGNIVSASEVGLATGSRILLQPVGTDGRVSVLVATTDDSELDGDAIRNSGEVEAAMVTMEATGSAYATAINNEGIIRAQNFDTSGGRVRLTGMGGDVRNSGSIDATGSTGGEVVVTGEEVYLTDGSLIDASGDFGGGDVKVGGGIQGQDASVANATNLFIGDEASISADALISGSGGEVITFTEGQAIILGTLSVNGAGGGSGGFVETSGLEYLVVAKAPNIGPGGEWLIDPNNIEIVAGAGNTNINAADPFLSTDDTAQLGVDLIVGALTGGASVSVTTGTGGANAEDGNITLSTTLDYEGTGSNSLTFNAANDIIINGAITDSVAGGDLLNLTLNANNDASGTGAVIFNENVNLGGGNLILGPNTDGVTQTSGNIAAGILSAGTSGSVDLSSAGNDFDELIGTNAGNLTIVDVDGLILDGLDVGANTLDLTTGGPLTDSASTTAGSLVLDVTGAATLDEVSNDFDSIAGSVSGNLTVVDTDDLDLAGIDVGVNDLDLTTGGDLTDSAANTAGNLILDVTGTATLDEAGNDFDSLQGIATGDVVLVDTDDLDLAGIDVGANDLDLTTAGNLTDSAANLAGSLLIDITGTTTLDELLNDFDNVAGAASDSVTIGDVDDLNIGALNIGSNNMSLSAGGAVTQTSALQVGDLTVTSSAAGITLDGSSNQISGTLVTSVAAGEDTLVNNNLATELGSITATGGNFTLNSLGAITQTGPLDLASTTTSLKTQNNTGAAITLNDPSNQFGTLSVQVRDLADAANAVADISIDSDNGFTFETLATGGNVSLASGGLVTQTATSTLDIAGELSIDTTDFAGAGDVSYTQATGDIEFSGDTIVQGDLTVTASTGGADVIQSASSTVSVAGTLDANAGLGGDVTLTDSDNVINSLDASDGSVFIRSVGDVDIDGSLVSGPIGGNLTVIALDEGNEFAGAAATGTDAVLLNVGGASNNVGTVNFTTENSGFVPTVAGTNDITQSVLLDVAGTSSFSSAGAIVGDITLTDPSNSFVGSVSANGGAISITDSTATVLGAITADSLVINTDGSLTQVGGTALDVTGTSTFTVSATGGAIALTEDNLMDGAVTVTQDSASDVSINNDQSLVLGAISLTDAASNLSLSSSDAITQTGAITMAGGTLDVSATNSATLDQANNIVNLGDVTVGGDFALSDTDGFTMDGTVDASSGEITLDADGTVTQTAGSITATGLELTGTGSFDLSQAANDVDALAALIGGTLTYVDADGLALGSTVGATTDIDTDGADVTATTGNLTVDGAIRVGPNDLTLESTAGSIVQGASGEIAMGGGNLNLNNGAGGAVGTSGTPIETSGDYTLNAAPTLAGGVFVNNTTSGDVVINTLTPADGDISITNAAGAITVSNAVESTVNGDIALSASGALNLDDDITGVLVTLDNDGALTRSAGTVNASTSLTLEGDGNVGDGTGANYLETSTPLIVLNKPTSGDVYISDVTTDLNLRGLVNGILAVSATDDLSVPAGQDLQNDSASLTALIAGGSINPGATAGSVILNNGGLWLNAGTQIGTSAVALMDFSNAGILTAEAAGPIFLNNTAGDLSIGSLDASSFAAVNGGFASQVGITTNTAGQSIGLESASDTVVTVDDVISSNGGNISIVVDTGVTSGIVVDALIESGAIGGGNYVIGGGVTVNVNPRAITGTTITLDGGGQDITIASDQSYAGAVSFNAPGDILISAQLQATGANGNITLISDVDDDGQGGIRVFDDGGTFGLVTASGLITASGSDLIQNGLGDFNSIQLDAGSNRVVSSSAVQSIILETSTSVADARNILINGNVVNNGTGTLVVQSNGSAASDILVAGSISATAGVPSNTMTFTSPGTVNLEGTISTASTSPNAIVINNEGTLSVDGGVLTASNSGGLSLSGAGQVASGVGGDVLLTQGIGRFTFNKAGTDVFINQAIGDAAIQGTVGGLVLTVPGGTITNSAALTADRVAVDASGDITLTSSNSIDRFVSAPGATGMSANVQANAISTFGNFSYTAAGGSDLLLGDTAATGAFGTTGEVSVFGTTTFNMLTGSTNFSQLANSEISGTDITFNISGTGDFASDVGGFGTTNIVLNNTGAVTRSAVTNPTFTATGSLTLSGTGSVGTLADALLTNVSRLTLNKPGAVPATGDVFIDQINGAGSLIVGGTSGASVSINMLGIGQSITQDTALNIGPGGFLGAASAGPEAANNTNATLSVSTVGGSVLLTNLGNKVRNFGSVDVVNGSFEYNGALGAIGVETRLTDDISVTGVGAGITIVYGGTEVNRRDLVIENGVSILSDGDVLISRNSNTLAANGTVYLGGNITTANDSNISFQTGSVSDIPFTPVVLTNDVILATNSATLGAGNVTFDGPVSNTLVGPATLDLTINAGLGNIYFQDLVGGAAGAARIGDLTANSGGDTTFNDQVFATNVTTDAGGSTILVFDNAGGFAVDTTEDQEYNDSVLLVNDIDLRSDSDVTFNGTVDSSTAVEADARNLYVEASGVTSFNDNVGVTNFLETLETDAPGSVAINDNDIAAGITIRTRGTQTYGADAGIIVGGGTTGPNTLTTHTGASDSVPGDILLNGGLDGKTAGVNDLLLIAGDVSDASITGDIVFDGAGGATTEMGDIVIRVADNVDVNGSIASTTFLQEAGLSTTTLNGSITTSSASTPGFASAPIVAGGGIQIFANSITVNDDLQANNNGRILLNSGTDLFIVETTVETTGTTTANAAVNNRIDLIAADDVIVGSPFQGAATTVQTGNGAINIEAGNSVASGIFEDQGVVIAGNAANLTLVSAGGDDNGTVTITADSNDSSDILVNSATVEATGIIASATQPAITFTAADDIVIGDFNADAVSIVQTTNGAIRFTASNGTSPDSLGENADGILIEGSGTNGETGIVIARGVENGDIDFNALDRASVEVRGGDFAISSAIVDAADDMTIDIEDGDLMVRGGFGADSAARVTSAGTQTINLTEGNMSVMGGNAANTLALVGADETQEITLTDGSLTVTGGFGDASLATITLSGDANQTITVELGDVSLSGGSGDATGAGIVLDGDGQQTVIIGNDVDDGLGNLSIQGGSGEQAFAGISHGSPFSFSGTNTGVQVIEVDNNVDITGGTGDQALAGILHAGIGDQSVTLGGNTASAGDGDLNITGGDGIGASAAIIAGSAELQDVILQGGSITIQGNLDSANAGGAAGIVSQSSTTTQTINVSGGSDIFLIGGSGDDDLAQIFSGGIQDIDATGIISLTGGSAASNGAFAEIRAVGNQSILAENNANLATAITIQGGSSTGADDYALIVGGTDGTSTQTIITSQGDIVLSGLEGNSSGTLDSSISEFGAGIINNGLAQTITLNGDGDLSLTGGTIGDSAAAIEMTNANGIQDIDVGTNSGSLTLNGGTGEDAYALIRSLGTVASAQSIQVQDDITLNGNAATSSFAINGQNIGAAISSVGPQDIDTLTVGSISLTGGTVDNSAALISANDSQTVTINDEGDLTITGGSGNTSSAGILLVGDADQTVDVLLGDAALQGGAGDNSSAGIQLVGNGLQTVTVGNDTADGDGNLSITGGAGDFAFAGIENTGTGDQFVNADNNVTLFGGTGDTTNAAIHQSGSGDQFVTLGGAGGDLVGDLLITGGNGNDADAYILANGADVQTVTVQEGSLSITGNQDATNDFSEAYIQSFSVGTTQTVDVSSSDVTSGNITLQAGTGTDERARILSGNIQDIDATGVLSMTGGNGAAAQSGSFADIRANATQTINVVNSNDNAVAINIQGGSSDGADDYALIVGGTDDTATQTIATTRGDIVLAGNAGNSSVPVDDSTTEFGAGIINNGLAQTITLNGAGDLSLTGGTIDDSAALIEMTNVAANATQSITVGVDSGDLLLNGGTGEDAYALIRSQGTGVTGADIAQVIQVQDSITLNGNSATSSELLDGQSVGAAIVSDGTQDIDTLTDGSITLTGGDVTASGALVASTSLTGDQTIDVNGVGNFSVLGGVGGIADAIVRGAGLNQSIVVTDGNLLLDAGDATNSDSDALIAATNTGAALQFIDVEGTISVLGGDGGNENAAITAAGYDSSFGRAQDINALSGILIQAGDANAGNDALIESFGSQSQQLVIVQNNNLEIFGGSGSVQSAFIRAAGVNDSFNSATGDEAAQRIDVQSGNLIVDADPTSSSAVGNLAFIESTNTDEASQYITVNGTTEVLGGDGGGDFAWIRSSGFDSSIGLAQTLISQQAVTLQSGDAGGGDASIESFGSQGRQLIDVINGDLSVISGNGSGNQTFIRTAGLNQGFNALTGLNAAQRISVRAGNLIVDADPNGTTGGGASAFIESLNTGTASQYITVNGTTDVLAGDAGGNEAYIRANGFDASLGLAQALISQQAVTIQSGDAGGGNAFIQSTGNEGSQFISVATGDLSILSGSGGGNQAYIRTSGLNEAGGQLAQTVVVEDGNLLIDAFSGTGGTQAFIDSTNDGDATQRIEVQGTASILAGDDGGELAFIRSAGYDGAQGLAQDIFIRDGLLIEGGADTGGNDATIETTGLQGRQAIVVESGGIQILGGSGAGQDSGIFNAGINGPSSEFAQFIQIQAGDLLMDAGDNVATGTSVNIVASNTGAASQVIEVQTGAISILGGDGDNDIAQITSAGFDGSQGLAQSIFALNDILVEGGEGTSSEALVLATGTQGRQLMITQTGDFSVLAGSGEAASARVEASGLNGAGASQQAQRILVQDGNMILDAGDGLNANANALVSALNTGEATQLIDVNGTLTLQGGEGLDERAEILAQGFDATPGLAQTVTSTGDISLTGGLGDNSLAGINSTGSQGRQVVTTTTGDLTLLGGDGIDAEAQITANGTDGAGLNEQAQRVLVQSGALTMSASTAVDGGDATIDSFGANQSQFINVDGTPAPAGTLTVNGGASGTVARISSAGAQDIEVENEIDINALLTESDVDITAVDTQNITSENADIDVVATGTDATVDITAGLAQTIDAATSIDLIAANNADITVQNTLGNQELLAGTDITVDADSAATVLIQADDGTQTLTAGGLIDLNSNNVDTDITINSAAGPQDIDADTTSITMTATDLASINVTAAEAQSLDAVTSIDMIADTDGDIVIQNTLGNQELLAGTDITVDADSAADVLVQADAGTQTLTAQNAITVNADNTDTSVTFNSLVQDQDINAVTGGITLDANDEADIFVTAQTNQTVDAQTFIDVDASNSGNVLLEARTGTQDITAATGDITLNVTSNDDIQILAGDAQAIDATLGSILATVSTGGITIQNDSGTQDLTAGTDIVVDVTDGAATIEATDGDQLVQAGGDVDVDLNSGLIRIESVTAEQDIIADTGDVTFDGINGATISVLAGLDQLIEATLGSVTGSLNTGSLTIQNDSGAQTVDADVDIILNLTNGALTVEASDGVQTLTAGNDIDMDVTSGNLRVESVLDTQTLTAEGGNLTLDVMSAVGSILAGDQQRLEATLGSIEATLNGGGLDIQNDTNAQDLVAGTDIALDATSGTLTVVATNGVQTLDAGQDIDIDGDSALVVVDSVASTQTLEADNDVTINSTNGSGVNVLSDLAQLVDAINGSVLIDSNASSTILVQNTTGTQDVQAGADIVVDASGTSTARIEALAGVQTLEAVQLLELDADGVGSAIFVNSASDDQTLSSIGSDIALEATNSANIVVTADSTQNVLADGSITMDAQTSGNIIVENFGEGQELSAGESLTLDAQSQGTILVQTDDGNQLLTGDLVAATADGAGSSITVNSISDAQDIESYSSDPLLSGITLTASDQAAVNVTAEGNQALDAQTFIDVDASGDSSVLVESTSGTQLLIATDADITMDATGASDILVQAGDGEQSLTAGGLIDLNANGNLSEITINADSLTETQTLSADGGILAEASDDANISILADFTQVLTSTGAIALRNFVTGTLLGGDVLVQNTNGDQTLTAGTDLTMDALEGTITVQADNGLQTLSAANAGGEILLNADTDSDILITSVLADQVLTSDGVTDMTGINDGTVLVTAINSNLNSAGGVWTDDVTVGTAGTTEIVTINNSGAITVADVDPLHVHVNADTGPASIIFDGAGSVGATDPTEVDDLRLVTNTDTMIFDDAAKTVALDERVGDVEIEGLADSINLILSSTGNLTDSAAIVANTATLLTSDGDIDLDSSEIAEFQGVIADGGIFITSDIAATTFSNRAVSADIPAGEGIFATGDIEIFSADEITVTADAVRSSGGNLLVDADSLILNASAGSTGGINGPTGAVGTITTDLGDQTYDAPITLLTNTQMAAPNGGALIQFNETMIGPGGLELAGDAILNSPIGTLIDPISYLLLNGDTTFDSTAILDPDAITVQSDPSLTAIIGGSLINTGTMTFAQDASIMVDAQTLSSPESVFDGGDILGLTGPGAVDLTIFAGDTGSVSALSGLPSYPENFSSWDFDGSLPNPFSFMAGNAFQPNAIFYRDAPPTLVERDNERMRRLGSTKTATVAYESEESDDNVSASLGRVGGLRTSSFELFDVSTSTQTVFNDVVVLP
jgi:filamentous hemagglutinin family protein